MWIMHDCICSLEHDVQSTYGCTLYSQDHCVSPYALLNVWTS